VPRPGRCVDARMRATRLLLFLKAYSVLLADSSCSSFRRRKRRLTRGMKEALHVVEGVSLIRHTCVHDSHPTSQARPSL
jgi:hypothetical protein